jgi:hypothetical protein
MHNERTFRTDGGRDAAQSSLSTLRVSGLTCRVKKISCTDDGKLTMAIDALASDAESLEQVRDLLAIQQGEVVLSLEGVIADPGEESLQ